MSTFRVALVGRPNVGKSSLFNRLVGASQALVDKTPGLTRDWQEGSAKLGDLLFTVIDTAGFEDEKKSTLAARMWTQSVQGLQRSDVIVFVVDAKEGLTPVDTQIARFLRSQNKPIILVANKGENAKERLQAYEFFSLGLGDPIFLSAAHSIGFSDFYEALMPFVKETPSLSSEETSLPRIDLAIVGRPNAGKSTFVNALLGEERLLTGEEAGITRDAIALSFSYENHLFRLIDTAGLRKKARVVETLEKLSTRDTMEAIRMAQGVILVVDAVAPLEKQDLTIARFVIDEGRMLIIALNKWDLIKDQKEKLKEIQYLLNQTISQLKGLVFVPMSALKKRHVDDALKAILDLYPLWNKRLPTADLNRWLEEALAQHPPPLVGGRRCKIRYVTQIKSRPPTFLAFSNRPEEVWPDSYKRYLLNHLRETFKFDGVPLRLNFKTSKNPYVQE